MQSFFSADVFHYYNRIEDRMGDCRCDERRSLDMAGQTIII